jgi:hypothetical protein
MPYDNLVQAVKAAKERSERLKATMYVIQIGEKQYVLWRDTTIEALPLVYEHYRIVAVIDYVR